MTVPDTMTVCEIVASAEGGDLRLGQRPVPVPAADEVVIRVAYAGLNRADCFQRQGSYAPPAGVTDIPGLECSGTIAAVGDQVTRWQVGDQVCALLSGGGYAAYALVKAGHALPIPHGIMLKEAAALPECVATVWLALWEIARVQPDEVVLVHGGSSGIGTTAIQMLKALGCAVFTTVGNAAKAEAVAALGAEVILYKEQDFTTLSLAGRGGVDVVLDMVGGDYMQRNLKVLRPRGRLISLAFLQGAVAELSLGGLLMKQLSWHGLTLRGRTDSEKTALMQEVEQVVWPWVEQGRVRPLIDSVFGLSEAAAAQARMEKHLHIGKILLEVSG